VTWSSEAAGLVAGARRIAVLRANALGDLMFSMPALEALRAAYPEAEIALLGRDWHREFLMSRPSPVDEVIVLPPVSGVTREPAGGDAGELEAFLQEVRARRFDLAIQLHGGGRFSNAFVSRLGATVTAGMRSPDAPALDRELRYVYYQPEVARYLEVVALVGAPPVVMEPRLALTSADLRASLAEVPDEDRRPLAVIHPGATDPRRRWPVERFAALASGLAASGARLAVTGTAAERPLIDELTQAAGCPLLDLGGRLSLSALTGLLARSAVVVSNDTGPLHLAAAAGSATVGIFWCGNLLNGGPFTRGRHRPAISWTVQCPVCGVDSTRQRCSHDVSFVAGVEVPEVLDSARDLLSDRSRLAHAPGLTPGTRERPVSRDRPLSDSLAAER
jgi:ADP-heptose:LPS heptosyltransferase